MKLQYPAKKLHECSPLRNTCCDCLSKFNNFLRLCPMESSYLKGSEKHIFGSMLGPSWLRLGSILPILARTSRSFSADGGPDPFLTDLGSFLVPQRSKVGSWRLHFDLSRLILVRFWIIRQPPPGGDQAVKTSTELPPTPPRLQFQGPNVLPQGSLWQLQRFQ